MSLDFYLDHLESKGWGKPVTDSQEKNKPTSDAPKGSEGHPTVDREHHVPLLASALMDGSGGIAIDHRADIPKEYEKYLIKHESIELEHMQNLIKGGMDPHKAYEEAHDKHATPIEHAAVKADLGEEGLEKYKAKMREEAAKAKEPSDRDRHPDAHTTRFALDESNKMPFIPSDEEIRRREEAGILPTEADITQMLKRRGYNPTQIREWFMKPENWYGHEGDTPKDIEEDWGRAPTSKAGTKNKLAMDYGHGEDEMTKPPLQLDVLGTTLTTGPGAAKMQMKRPANENTNVKEFPVNQSVKDFNMSKAPTTTPGSGKFKSLDRLLDATKIYDAKRLDVRREMKEDELNYRATRERLEGRILSEEEHKYLDALGKQRLDRTWEELKRVQKEEKPKADIIPFKKPE